METKRFSKALLTIDQSVRRLTLTLDWTILFLRDICMGTCHPGWGGLEYLHRSPASRKRRRKGNP
jgi:hypothetical protein